MPKKKQLASKRGPLAKRKRASKPASGATAYNASFLRQPDAERYLALSAKGPLSQAEQAERLMLLKKAEASRKYVSRAQASLPKIEQASQRLRKHPNDPAAQRDCLREIIAPCYPDVFKVLIELGAHDKYKLRARAAAREGLDGVLYVMDHTRVIDVINDPPQRLAFLAALNAMLEPFRKLRAHGPDSGKPLDLKSAFEFRATKRGGRTRDHIDKTLLDWDAPCFELHLLCLAGVRPTQAQERVAAVHGKTVDALRKAHKSWSSHPVRAEVLRRGDVPAREILVRSQYQTLLATAYPVLSVAPRPHRPA